MPHHFILCFATVLALVFITACDSLEDPEDIDEKDILNLQVNGPHELKADGVDMTRIVARIPERAEKLDIKFTTTKGVFVLSASKEISAFADSIEGGHRYAAVDLRADTSRGTAYIKAEVKDQRRRIAIQFK